MAEETRLKYQVSLFGDFSRYGVTEENLRKCFDGFFKFQMLPNQIQESNPGGSLESRISLQSIHNGIAINLLSDRMDILAMPMVGNPAAKLTVDSFVETSLPIADELLRIFPATINRIGFVVESFMAEVPAEKLDGVRAKFLCPKLPFASELPTNEWNIRDVVLGELAGVSSNFIFSIARVKAHTADARGVREKETHHLMVDVNSSANQGIVFKDFSAIQGFVLQSVEKYKVMKSDIEGRVHG